MSTYVSEANRLKQRFLIPIWLVVALNMQSENVVIWKTHLTDIMHNNLI